MESLIDETIVEETTDGQYEYAEEGIEEGGEDEMLGEADQDEGDASRRPVRTRNRPARFNDYVL